MQEKDSPVSSPVGTEKGGIAEPGTPPFEPGALLRTVAEVTSDAIFVKDRQGRYLFVNPAAARFLGRPAEEILGQDDARLAPPEMAKAIMADDRRVLESGRTATFENVGGAAGATRVFLSTKSPYRDAQGNVIGIVGISRDITSRKQSEEELRLSEERFARAFHASPVATSISELATGRILDVNDRFCALLSHEREGILGRTSLEIGHWADPGQQRQMVEAVERVGFVHEREALLRTRSGQIRTVLGSMERIELLGQACVLEIFIDITDRKRNERDLEELLRREQVARRAAQAGEEASRFLARASRVLSSSLNYRLTLRRVADLAVPRIADLCQVDLRGPEGESELLALSHADPAKVERLLELRRRFPPRPDEPAGPARVLRTGQSERWEEISDTLLASIAQGEEHLRALRELGLVSSMSVPIVIREEVVASLTFATAESGRRYGPADLDLVEKLAGVAAMAVENARLYRDAQRAIRHRDDFLSIAGHELKTPLATLQLEVQRLARLARAGEPPASLLERAEKMQRSVARLSRLIDELLDVSRITSGHIVLERETVDLSGVVREVAERAAEDLARAAVSLTLKIEEGIEGVWDRVRLEQVVGNLLSNAIKYGKGRPVEIETRREGEGVWLVVRDQGIGISESDQARIFHRFERAVSERHFGGFGLGLWIVGQIVEALGGRTAVESRPEAGSTFRVWLPLRPPEQSAGPRVVGE